MQTRGLAAIGGRLTTKSSGWLSWSPDLWMQVDGYRGLQGRDWPPQPLTSTASLVVPIFTSLPGRVSIAPLE